jgi:hypothetical protein
MGHIDTCLKNDDDDDGGGGGDDDDGDDHYYYDAVFFYKPNKHRARISSETRLRFLGFAFCEGMHMLNSLRQLVVTMTCRACIGP